MDWESSAEEIIVKLQHDLKWLEMQRTGKRIMGDVTPIVQGMVEPSHPDVNIHRGERIGHADRQRTIQHLAEVADRGYIKAEEAEARIRVAENAEDRSEISVLTVDLPPSFHHPSWVESYDFNNPRHWVPTLILGMAVSAIVAAVPASVFAAEHMFPETGLGIGVGIAGLIVGVIGFFSCLAGLIAKTE